LIRFAYLCAISKIPSIFSDIAKIIQAKTQISSHFPVERWGSLCVVAQSVNWGAQKATYPKREISSKKEWVNRVDSVVNTLPPLPN